MIKLKSIHSQQEIQTLAKLAKDIWQEHFEPIIGMEQVQYMLGKFQSPKAIEEQLTHGYCYKLLFWEECPIGYYAICPQQTKMFLSKLYIKKEYRGKGYARVMLQDIVDQSEGMTAIYLTVNKENHNSIAAYKKMGFAITELKKADIGKGFYMDDYIMEKAL